MRRITRLAAIVAGALALVAAATAQAAPTGAAFTIRETLPATTGSLVAGTIPGCSSSPTVYTENGSVATIGPLTIFRGDKRIDCGGGDELTLRFVAGVVGCSASDSGVWRVIGGSGAFAGVRGAGVLRGDYRYEGGPGTSCMTDGIDDNYRGVLVFP